MRCILAIATLAAVAALTFGGLAAKAPGGAPHNASDRGAVEGAVSYRALAVTPRSGHWSALQTAFTRTHGRLALAAPRPLSLLEAKQQRVLWALATFALGDGTIVAERFNWRPGMGWRDLGATRALCPAVPSEVRSAWRLAKCR